MSLPRAAHVISNFSLSFHSSTGNLKWDRKRRNYGMENGGRERGRRVYLRPEGSMCKMSTFASNRLMPFFWVVILLKYSQGHVVHFGYCYVYWGHGKEMGDGLRLVLIQWLDCSELLHFVVVGEHDLPEVDCNTWNICLCDTWLMIFDIVVHTCINGVICRGKNGGCPNFVLCVLAIDARTSI